MDLSKIGPAEHGVLELVHPVTGVVLRDGDQAVTITLAGRDSDAYRKVLRTNQNRRLESRGRPARISVEQVEEEELEILAACTMAWQGVELDGKVLECTPANVRKVYSDGRTRWVREQVDAFIADRVNFFPNSRPTS